jgi:hypothetical protein
MESSSSKKSTRSSKKNSAATKIQRVLKRYTQKRHMQTSAAKKIQKAFRNYRINQLNKMLKDPTCLKEPINIKNENLYMYVKIGEREKHLFNIFNFKSMTKGIKDPSFFKHFHEMISTNFDEFGIVEHSHKFFFTKNSDGFTLDVLIRKNYKEKETNQLKEKYESLIQSYFLPFFLYILANCKLDMDEFDEENGFCMDMSHPKNVSEVIGIHKDESIRTCLTYVDSPLTTEIAFDVAVLSLPWFSCSPLFRFKTTDKLYTLCFNDKFIEHTVPFYEEAGKDVSEINPLEEYETMRENAGFLEFGEMSTANRGKNVYRNINGKVIKLPKKEKLDWLGRSVPLQNITQRYKKPDYRKKMARPETRKVLATFLTEMDVDFSTLSNKSVLTMKIPFSKIRDYNIDSLEERIELTEDSVNSIITKPFLGDFEFSGGN